MEKESSYNFVSFHNTRSTFGKSPRNRESLISRNNWQLSSFTWESSKKLFRHDYCFFHWYLISYTMISYIRFVGHRVDFQWWLFQETCRMFPRFLQKIIIPTKKSKFSIHWNPFWDMEDRIICVNNSVAIILIDYVGGLNYYLWCQLRTSSLKIWNDYYIIRSCLSIASKTGSRGTKEVLGD